MADIRAIADRGTAVVLVSHNIDLAATIADRIVVCDLGRTVDEITPAQLASGDLDHCDDYTRALIHALPSHGFRLPTEVNTPATPELAAL